MFGCALERAAFGAQEATDASVDLDAAVDSSHDDDASLDAALDAGLDALTPEDASLIDAPEMMLDAPADVPTDVPVDMGAPDVCMPRAELCDGVDNDCDPSTEDGASEPQLGMPCDGGDSDLCPDGAWACQAGGMICVDPNEDHVEVCDATDNDCDGMVDNSSNACGFECTPQRFGSSIYLLCGNNRSWTSARDACNSLEGYALVTIDGMDENNFLEGVLPDERYWIGLNDRDDEGDWEWVRGSSSYERFESGEPNNFAGEDCVEIIGDNGRWNDRDCGRDNRFVCEAVIR